MCDFSYIFVQDLLIQLSESSKYFVHCEAGFNWESDIGFGGSSTSKDAFNYTLQRIFQ